MTPNDLLIPNLQQAQKAVSATAALESAAVLVPPGSAGQTNISSEQPQSLSPGSNTWAEHGPLFFGLITACVLLMWIASRRKQKFTTTAPSDAACSTPMTKSKEQEGRNKGDSLSGDRGGAKQVTSPAFISFRNRYLLVYYLMYSADAIQGPYIYKLYQVYGFNLRDTANLFIMGFGSSMLAGTVVGSLADAWGRRANCLLYAVLYALSCVTKHFNNYNALLVGRLLGGVATSILFSGFESWVVAEHRANGFDRALLGDLFAKAIFGSSLFSIVAGVLANAMVEVGGIVAPFDASIFILVIASVIMMSTWGENYGGQKTDTLSPPTPPHQGDQSDGLLSVKVENANICSVGDHNFLGFRGAIAAMNKDKRILLLGITCSLFEGVMFIFVFMWTPALEMCKGDTELHHGLVFAEFMICMMMGSQLFEMANDHHVEVHFLIFLLLATSVACMGLVAVYEVYQTRLMLFLLFELCIGVYWPASSVLRSHIIPESCRATVMSLFRIPLNWIVLISLIGVDRISQFQCFMTCAFILVVSLLCQHQLSLLDKTVEKETHSF